MFQVYCGLPAQRGEHTHVRCLGLFHIGWGFPGDLQWLLRDGRRHRSRHCSHILSVETTLKRTGGQTHTALGPVTLLVSLR